MAFVSKTYSRILALMLAWAGVSCDKIINGAIEYGTPHATCRAKGTVVSQTDGKPIKGIRVVMTAESTDGAQTDTYTDDSGNFQLTGTVFSVTETIYVNLKDVDGEENGLFMDKQVELNYKKEDFTGGKDWYQGEAEKNTGTITMTSKK